MYEQLKGYLLHNTSLKTDEIDYVINFFNVVSYPAGKAVIESQRKVNHLFFVNEGILKAEEVTAKGNHIIHYFVAENQFFSEASGLYMKENATLSLTTVIPSTILSLDFQSYEKVSKENPAYLNAFHIASEIEMTKILNAQKITRSGNAQEKYQLFYDELPHIVKRISGNDVAAFLGITKYTLSRIKAKIVDAQ